MRPGQGCGCIATMFAQSWEDFDAVSAWVAHAAGTKIFLLFLLMGSDFFLFLRLYYVHTLLYLLPLFGPNPFISMKVNDMK